MLVKIEYFFVDKIYDSTNPNIANLDVQTLMKRNAVEVQSIKFKPEHNGRANVGSNEVFSLLE